jgi:hypothetical protein
VAVHLAKHGAAALLRACDHAVDAAAKEKAEAERPPINYLDGARRIAFMLRRAYEEKGRNYRRAISWIRLSD